MLLKIVSGGQTGTDRGALDAALELGAECGGWCPKGRRAEDGGIDIHYPLKEMASEDYVKRTKQNVIDSDGTLIIYYADIEGGTARTVEFCQQHAKPSYLIDATLYSPDEAVSKLKSFVEKNHIYVLNVAGPRASKQSGAEGYSRALITGLLKL